VYVNEGEFFRVFFFFFPLQKKNKNNSQNANEKEKVNEMKNENETQKKENGEGEKKKKEAGPIPVVLKIPMHCDGCADKIKRRVRGFEGISLSDLSKSCAFFIYFVVLDIGPLSFSFVYFVSRNMLEKLGNGLASVCFFSALYLPFSLGFFL